MTFYLFLADRHGTASGARWAIMGIAVKVGQSVSHMILLLSCCSLTDMSSHRLVYVRPKF